MNIELRDRWIAALESGKYAKGKGALKYEDRYCCLGVLGELCDLMVQRNEYGLSKVRPEDEQVFDETAWLGDYSLVSQEDQKALAEINDISNTFEPVVAKIRRLFPDEADR